MEYFEQVERLIDSLIFGLQKLPSNIDNHNVFQTSINLLINLKKECVITQVLKDTENSIVSKDKTLNETDILNESTGELFLEPINHGENILEDSKFEKDIEDNPGSMTINEDEESKEFESNNPHLDFEEINSPKLKEHKDLEEGEMDFPIKIEDEDLKYNCIICQINFENLNDVAKHDEETHKMDINFCCPMQKCDYKSTDKIRLLDHFAKEQKRPFNIKYCPECKHGFFHIDDVKCHLKSVHQKVVSDEECIYCNKIFESSEKVRLHTRFHTQILVCRKPKCFEKFETESDLLRHKKEDHIEKPIEPFTCNICGITMKASSKANHLATHSTTKNFECDSCDKKFSVKAALTLHVRNVHLKHLICEFCDYSTGMEGRLREHMNIHSTNQPFTCDICSRRFKKKDYLDNHMVSLHGDERKYKCEKCEKAFKHAKHLNEHRRIHNKDFKAKCHICDKQFIQKYNMVLHLKKQHPEALLN